MAIRGTRQVLRNQQHWGSWVKVHDNQGHQEGTQQSGARGRHIAVSDTRKILRNQEQFLGKRFIAIKETRNVYRNQGHQVPGEQRKRRGDQGQVLEINIQCSVCLQRYTKGHQAPGKKRFIGRGRLLGFGVKGTRQWGKTGFWLSGTWRSASKGSLGVVTSVGWSGSQVINRLENCNL